MSFIADNVLQVRQAIKAACDKAHRKPEDVRLVAVSKSFDAAAVAQAVEAGVADIGENYLQEALPKKEALKGLPIHWHFIGHLQRNKAAMAGQHFQLIQSVDSWRLAERLNQCREMTGKPLRILLQLKTGSAAAHGFSGEELLRLRGKLLDLPGLEIVGIMTLGAPVTNPEDSRPLFRSAAKIFAELRKDFPPAFKELSMGMSGDFEVAIEEGSTMVRIGKAIFGERRRKDGI